MTSENTDDSIDSRSHGQMIYYIVLDDEGIWMMTRTPDEVDEILIQTMDLITAERALCIEMARCN